MSYLQLYYCSLADAKSPAFLLLVLWTCLLFSTIGIAASDFLCINLSTIATVLGMSESFTGVTFLAFGNGSPDVFSTFAAMGSNSGSLAVGELIGAASFISAVVAGSMALVKPFKVAKRSFIRDVGFFAVAASFSLVFLGDGSLRLWECAVMIAYYLFYVVFVVTWHWWLARRRRQRRSETAARLQQHIPDAQELEMPGLADEDEEARPASERTELLRAPSGESVPGLRAPGTPVWKIEDVDEDDEARDRYLAELQSNMRVSRPHRGERRNTMTPIRPSLIGALEFRSVLSSLEKKSTHTQPIGLRRYSDDPSTGLTPTPITAPAALHPELVSDFDIDDEAHAGHYSHAGRGRAVSANATAGLRWNTDFLNTVDDRSETAISSADPTPPPLATESKFERPSADFLRTLNEPERPISPTTLLSPSAPSHRSDEDGSQPFARPRSPNWLVPPETTFHRPDYEEARPEHSRSPAPSPKTGPTLQVPILHTPHPTRHRSPLQTEFPPYTDSPKALTPSPSRPPSIRLPVASISPESTHNLALLQDEGRREEGGGRAGMRTFHWWPYKYLPSPQVLGATLFPTLCGWREKGVMDKILALVTCPSVFLLTITLPVVEPKVKDDTADDPDPALLALATGPQPLSPSGIGLPADPPAPPPRSTPVEAPPHPHGAGLSRQSTDLSKIVAGFTNEIPGAREWNRWLVILQLFTAPLFVVTIVWANLDDDHGVKLYVCLVLGSLVFSLLCLLVLLSATRADKEPKYRPLLCYLGFAVAIAWISTIANEVVGVLKAFGVIFDISDAILGLTIFAVGNSLGDLVADITVAKLGYPVMALSACFGGPMLNILLGIGVSGTYMTINKASHKHAQHPDKAIKYKPYQIEVGTTLIISGITLLVTLIGLLIVVPLNGWRMDRKIGIGLITLWCLSTVTNVVVELLGYGGELEMWRANKITIA